VDGRDEPGHDGEGGSIALSLDMSRIEQSLNWALELPDATAFGPVSSHIKSAGT